MKTYEATEQAYKNGYSNGYANGYGEGYEDGKHDARKKGRWEKPSKFGLNHKFDDLGVVCSECKKWNGPDSDFCPNCGADMRGEK